MRTTHARTLAVAVVTALTFTGTTSAQQRTPDILPAPQVRELVAGQQSADHAKLRAHFEALAAQYAADAERHTAFARAVTGIPRGAGAAISHHTRLAANAKQSATIVRELAAHHGQLAAGLASTAPPLSERFDKGAGAPATPTEIQMLTLAARAQMPSEHGLLAEYYTTIGRRYLATAKDHRTMAQAYRGQSRVTVSAAAHCDRLVQLSDESAKEALALAAEHQQLATSR